MGRVDLKRGFEVTSPEVQDPVQALPASVPTQRSAYALAWGARTGVGMTHSPSLRGTSSKTPVIGHKRDLTPVRGPREWCS
jgi:hypothetical protein